MMLLGRSFKRRGAAKENVLAAGVGNILPLGALNRSFWLDLSSCI